MPVTAPSATPAGGSKIPDFPREPLKEPPASISAPSLHILAAVCDLTRVDDILHSQIDHVRQSVTFTPNAIKKEVDDTLYPERTKLKTFLYTKMLTFVYRYGDGPMKVYVEPRSDSEKSVTINAKTALQEVKPTIWQSNTSSLVTTWSIVAAIYGSQLCNPDQIDILSQQLREYYAAKVGERKIKLNQPVAVLCLFGGRGTAESAEGKLRYLLLEILGRTRSKRSSCSTSAIRVAMCQLLC